MCHTHRWCVQETTVCARKNVIIIVHNQRTAKLVVDEEGSKEGSKEGRKEEIKSHSTDTFLHRSSDVCTAVSYIQQQCYCMKQSRVYVPGMHLTQSKSSDERRRMNERPTEPNEPSQVQHKRYMYMCSLHSSSYILNIHTYLCVTAVVQQQSNDNSEENNNVAGGTLAPSLGAFSKKKKQLLLLPVKHGLLVGWCSATLALQRYYDCHMYVQKYHVH